MKQIFKHFLIFSLVLSMLVCAVVPTSAARDEEYLSDLRIIYADNYNEAKQILAETEFKDYKILDANLNENTGEIGVYLAYKTTTDIEDAITDISVMQMKGGYQEGNYQAMVEKSYKKYVETGKIYLLAIDYFAQAYEAGNYLAEVAYRQLNLYNVVTEGIDEIPEFEGERLGDIFVDGIEATDLATMFMQGNSYVLTNVRSLIAMGVSYNQDGLTYLEKVEAEAEALGADPDRYQNENYTEYAQLISNVIIKFRTLLTELEAYEAELNYEDEEVTDLELKYLEYMVLAEILRGVKYTNDKTLYQFCMDYKADTEDYTSLYPLVAALNEGQQAMTKVGHFYDVVRFSIQLTEDEQVEAQLADLETKYGETPFNIYTGVDRSIYYGTFALTSAAYRSNAYTESGLAAALFKGEMAGGVTLAISMGVIGTTMLIASAVKAFKLHGQYVKDLAEQLPGAFDTYQNAMGFVHWVAGIGGVMTLISALAIAGGIYSYYYPTYDDIPIAMVDLIRTDDGDRYIKYDVVFEAEQQKDGNYAAGDLNAYQAARWNALYYTKSYEAGKPLLADEFVVSTNNNTPGKNYMPVHRFGETVCFNLNKYNFNEQHSIYLSVKQSNNQKAAVADVPELVGSMLSAGVLCLAGGIGVAIGVGCTIGTQGILKKKKAQATTAA